MTHSPPEQQSGVKRTVEQQFSQVAANYRSSAVHASGAELEVMVKLAACSGQERVLDAGCGPGHTALAFAPHVGQVVAVDLSEEMLAQGRGLAHDRAISNVEFRQADVEALPFTDGEFDLVVSRYSAHHWPDPPAALREFRRVLAPSGSLLLADVVSFDEPVIDTHVQTIELLRDHSHVRDHTTSQWLAILTGDGFTASVAFTWDLRLDFEAWVTRIATPPAFVAAVREVLSDAPAEVRAALHVEPNCSFTVRCALLQAARP